MFGIIFLFYSVLRNITFINDLYVDILNEFARFLLWASELLLNLFGFKTVTYGKTIEILDNFTNKGIYLDRGCMGRNVMLVFSALVFVFPGNWKNKLWYIPMGLIIIIFINVVRIASLTYISYRYPEHLDFNHYVVFRVVAWIAIFIMWGIWFNRLSGMKNKKSKEKNLESSGVDD